MCFYEISANQLPKLCYYAEAKLTYSLPQDILSPPTNVPNSLFLNPSAADEISCIIDSLKNKKAVRENDVDTKFTKLSKAVLSTSPPRGVRWKQHCNVG